MIENFKKLIEDFDKIIIFRHQVGDGDALGSQWAMYYYLKEKYPNKEIFAVGDETLGYENLFQHPHLIEDDKFTDALAIIMDTANKERISDSRFKLCKSIVKIDHHIKVDNYGDLEFVFPTVTSTAEIVTNLLRVIENNEPLSLKVANNLYVGLISDTQQFSIPGVNEDTFKTAAYLSKSNIEPGVLSRKLNEIDMEMFKFKNSISSDIVVDKSGLAYVKITNDHLKNFHLSHSQAKRNVNLMKNIEGINVWVLFIEQKDQPNVFDASIRANDVEINDIAQKFGGGGHKFASGVKNLDCDSLLQLIESIKAKL